MLKLKAAAYLAIACLLLALSPQPVAAQTAPTDADTPSLEEMIGQLLIVGFYGSRPGERWPSTVRSQLANGQIGGVIFLKYNLKGAAGSKALIKSFRDSGAKYPPLITVDQEGGAVQRLAGNVGLPRLMSERRVASKLSPEQALDYYRAMARSLKEFGFNVNLGPVVDVNTNPSNPIIGRHGRAFSADPETVATYGAAFIRAHREEGIITSLKHFPGHGSGRTDSHHNMVDISRSWQELELMPFARLIAEGLADTVMVGHLYLAGLQAGEAPNTPATLSPKMLKDVLRGRLGFNGVIISDDMEMGAIRRYNSFEDGLVRALKAGNDILILSNTHWKKPDLPVRAIASIKQAAEQDPELRARIADAFQRVIALKQRYLMPQPKPGAAQAAPSESIAAETARPRRKTPGSGPGRPNLGSY